MMLRYSLPFGAGAIWDCYRGFVLRGGAASAGCGAAARPEGGTGNQESLQPRRATPLRHAAALHHLRYRPDQLGHGARRRREWRRAARSATGHGGVSGALNTCNWLPGSYFAYSPRTGRWGGIILLRLTFLFPPFMLQFA